MSRLRSFIISILLLLIVVFAALFVSFNEERIALWLFRDFAARPLGWWVIMAFVSGGFLGLLLGAGVFRHWQGQRQIKQLKQQVQILEEENAGLRHPEQRDFRGGDLR